MSGLAYKKDALAIKADKMVRVLRGGNIGEEQFYFKGDDVFISSELVKPELYLRKNYMITPAVSSLDHIGKIALIDKDYSDTVVGGFVLMLIPHFNDDVVSEYRKGADGFPEVVPEEAVIVRRIYTRFMEGLTPGAIAKELTADGIPTPSGKQRWQTSTVESILQNEKYKGAALLQKCFTVDFLTKKRKVNEGEVPQYYVEHSHEPIITPEEFDKVQTELARRKQISRQYSGKSIFSSRIVCGDCGSYFGSKVWNSTSKYRRVIWQCNGKFKGEHKCETPHLDEETIKARFVTALNAIIENKDNILEDCRLMQATLTDCTGIDTEIESLLEEIDVVTELTKRCIAENSQMAQNQEEYAVRYNGFVERYEKAKARLEQLRTTKAAREAQAEAIGAFMFEVQELDALTEFDEKLWLTVIDTVTVHADGRMTFKFQGGKTLTSY